jgi:hypothetical protein
MTVPLNINLMSKQHPKTSAITASCVVNSTPIATHVTTNPRDRLDALKVPSASRRKRYHSVALARNGAISAKNAPLLKVA